MKEIDLFINSHSDIDEVMLYVGPDYKYWRLKEFIDRTNVKRIILTGDITDKQAKEILEPIKVQASIDMQKIPEELVFVPYRDLFKGIKTVKAIVFEYISDVTRIYKLEIFKPKYLLGEMSEQTKSFFTMTNLYLHSTIRVTQAKSLLKI